jgi:hypothetical protein
VSYDGQVRVYSVSPIPSGGISVQKKDRVQTKDGSIVELRSNPPGVIILLSDASSAVFESSGENSDYQVITLHFGRMRVINMTENQTILVRAGRSIVEIENGDVNIDYAIHRWNDEKMNRTLVVSAIHEGALVTMPLVAAERVELEKRGRVKTQEEKIKLVRGQVVMNAGETLYIDPIMSIVEKRIIHESLEPYWAARGYSFQLYIPKVYTSAFSRDLESRPAYPPVDSEYRIKEEAAKEKKRAAKQSGDGKLFRKVLGVTLGSVLVAGGAAVSFGMEAIAPDLVKDRNDKNAFLVIGFIPLGLGVITIIGSILW